MATFKLQIVFPDGTPVTFDAGSAFERDLIASCKAAILARGVGFAKTEAQVAQAIDAGMAAAILGLKKEARKLL